MNPYSDIPDWVQYMDATGAKWRVEFWEVGPSWWCDMRARFGHLLQPEAKPHIDALAKAMAPLCLP